MNEEFERLWDKTNEPLVEMGIQEDSDYNKNMARHYYLVGAKAALKKAAEVADNEANGFRNTRIAAAIRKIEVK